MCLPSEWAIARGTKASAMTLVRLLVSLVFLALALGAAPSPAADTPLAYDAFVKGATPQRGLFTIWHRAGGVYLELAASQLDREYVQTIVPASGLGANFVVYGNTDHLPAELVRFERAGDEVAIEWPNPYFVAPHEPSAARALAGNVAHTVVALAPIAAEDPKTGAIVIDAAPFLGDQLNLKAILAQSLRGKSKATPYELDTARTFFGATKAFPRNVLLHAMQTWSSDDQRLDDSVPDPRHVAIDVAYNIADPVASPGYRPRYADDRVGFYDDVYLTFDDDEVLSRSLRYAVRWNLQPSDPAKALSPATHPMIFYMSDTVPQRYRAGIRAGVLKWNLAFEKLGIEDALQVRDQPNDPNWDPDDIRYNVLRWVPEYKASFGADSQTLYDPRTGEEFRTGILISADVPSFALREWRDLVDPVRFGRATDPMPQKFLDDTWLSTILHETGHNLGLQHNFIGSRAYTAAELQDPAFTATHGIASTVMEYAPTNLWPRGTPQGDYKQTTLGPYDYYAMRWAYGRIPGAATPEDEIPALSKLAAAWSDPAYRYASDEDVSWANGHAADPRVEQGILTNDPLGWCDVQLRMERGIVDRLGSFFPSAGDAYESETSAFGMLMGQYRTCAVMPAHFIGGQYLSRAHRGDPGAEPPVVPVPYDVQRHAFAALDRYLFSATAFRFSPSLLQSLGYSEWAGYGYVSLEGYGNLPAFEYDPPARHDDAVADQVAAMQGAAIEQMFRPLVLARIADGASQTTAGRPMRLVDLFDWMHRSVFAELRGGRHATPIDAMRRTLQQRYVATLVALATQPQPGAPEDARSLARADILKLQRETAIAAHAPGLDRETLAHLADLHAQTHDALRNPHAGGGA